MKYCICSASDNTMEHHWLLSYGTHYFVSTRLTMDTTSVNMALYLPTMLTSTPKVPLLHNTVSFYSSTDYGYRRKIAYLCKVIFISWIVPFDIHWSLWVKRTLIFTVTVIHYTPQCYTNRALVVASCIVRTFSMWTYTHGYMDNLDPTDVK